MNRIDKISKETLNLLQYAKDTAVNNLTIANNTGKLLPRLDPLQLSAVVGLIDASLSQGYHKGLKSFQSIVKEQLSQEQTQKAIEPIKKK